MIFRNNFKVGFVIGVFTENGEAVFHRFQR